MDTHPSGPAAPGGPASHPPTTRVAVSVNGEQRTVDTVARFAAESIREDLGLTGTKIVCGHGACGACVIEVDGTPVASCLLAVEELQGREVRTVEGIADGRLHPVQRAFMAHDGLQCGYCTSGFIVESVAFYRAWRREHGTARPSRDEVARALAGHLCRCGSYAGIYAAVQAACAGDFDHPDRAVASARPDARDKVTGAARYTTDVSLPAMQHGRVVRAGIAHGKVISIDPGPALAHPGVTGFVELLDADRRIRYLGQAVGTVAAVDQATARTAADLVEVVYEEETAAFDIESALDEDAANIHGRGWTPPPSNEGPPPPNFRRGNRRGPLSVLSVRPLKAKRLIRRIKKTAPDRVVTGRWTASAQAHTPLEPHVTVARWPDGSSLEVYTSTQGVSATRKALAKKYHLKETDVTVVAEHVGGAFGAKLKPDLDVVAAVDLARQVHAPVKLTYDRNEELSYAGYRPSAQIDLTLAADSDGVLAAATVTSHTDGGASAGQVVAAHARFNYPKTPQFLADFDVLTNLPPAKQFRAPGGPAALWALEQAIDQLAGQLGLDPITMRERSSPTPLRQRVYDTAKTSQIWSDRSARRPNGRFRRGVGVAFGAWPYQLDRRVTVTVEATDHGLRVSASAQDMGNGTRGMLTSAVESVFGVSAESVEVRIGDVGAGHGPLSSGSRTTASLWPAAYAAASRLRDRLVDTLKARGEGADVVAVSGGVKLGGEFLDWNDVVTRTGPVGVTAGRPPDRSTHLWTRGITWMLARAGFGVGMTQGATLVEVEVDTLLGRVRPTRAHAIIGAGKIYAPVLAHSQVSGGIIQGLGYALYEERHLDPDTGLNLTANLEDYRIPGIGDTPEITVEFIEEGFGHVPGGGVGLSELATVTVAAATGNAVANATGNRPRVLPIRPGHVVGARK